MQGRSCARLVASRHQSPGTGNSTARQRSRPTNGNTCRSKRVPGHSKRVDRKNWTVACELSESALAAVTIRSTVRLAQFRLRVQFNSPNIQPVIGSLHPLLNWARNSPARRCFDSSAFFEQRPHVAFLYRASMANVEEDRRQDCSEGQHFFKDDTFHVRRALLGLIRLKKKRFTAPVA